MTNSNMTLHVAKSNKKDEFYTQFCDIERELQYYPSLFNGKTVYCNCDDAHKSNFVRYFIKNFNRLGLKRLVATCLRTPNVPVQQTLDQPIDEKTDAVSTYSASPMKLEINEVIEDSEDYTSVERQLTNTNNSLVPMRGNGDFRSAESVEILKTSDVVVTNPPFSLFREYVAQLMRYGKRFLIIGNINAITYKEIFSLIKGNKVWLGINLGRGISGFIVPESYELYGTEARIDEQGNRIISSNNCLWLTNLDNSMRHEHLDLTKTYYGNEDEYPRYDNYDAINVNRTTDIPMDYPGVMGVPITFLHKFNPEQFEIIRFRKGNDDKDLSIDGKCPYFRILIRNRHPLTCPYLSQIGEGQPMCNRARPFLSYTR